MKIKNLGYVISFIDHKIYRSFYIRHSAILTSMEIFTYLLTLKYNTRWRCWPNRNIQFVCVYATKIHIQIIIFKSLLLSKPNMFNTSSIENENNNIKMNFVTKYYSISPCDQCPVMSLCVQIHWWIHLIGCWCIHSIGDRHGKWRINSIKYSSFSIHFITLCLVVTIGEKPKIHFCTDLLHLEFLEMTCGTISIFIMP